MNSLLLWYRRRIERKVLQRVYTKLILVGGFAIGDRYDDRSGKLIPNGTIKEERAAVRDAILRAVENILKEYS